MLERGTEEGKSKSKTSCCCTGQLLQGTHVLMMKRKEEKGAKRDGKETGRDTRKMSKKEKKGPGTRVPAIYSGGYHCAQKLQIEEMLCAHQVPLDTKGGEYSMRRRGNVAGRAEGRMKKTHLAPTMRSEQERRKIREEARATNVARCFGGGGG